MKKSFQTFLLIIINSCHIFFFFFCFVTYSKYRQPKSYIEEKFSAILFFVVSRVQKGLKLQKGALKTK
mgnify:CR=1 FL=1